MNDDVRKRNVLIIAEGFEEKPYIDKILSFPNINKELYNFNEPINVKGNGNIPARYQYEIQRGFYDIVLVFCDADKGSDQFLSLVNKIGDMFFYNKEHGIKVFMFVNPVTLQIVLSHFGEVKLSKVSKKDNAEMVEKHTGIKNYDAKKEQIKEIIDKIHFSSMVAFKNRIRGLSSNFEDVPSSNFITFLERFESDDAGWIDEIKLLMK